MRYWKFIEKQGQQDHRNSAKNSLTIKNGYIIKLSNKQPKCYVVCEWGSDSMSDSMLYMIFQSG